MNLGVQQAKGNPEEAAGSRPMLSTYKEKGSSLRSNAKRREGGPGLVSVRVNFSDETPNFLEYIKKMAPSDALLGECRRQLKPTEEEDKPLNGMYH